MNLIYPYIPMISIKIVLFFFIGLKILFPIVNFQILAFTLLSSIHHFQSKEMLYHCEALNSFLTAFLVIRSLVINFLLVHCSIKK